MKYNSYGEMAIKAVDYIMEDKDPREAWELAGKYFKKSQSSIEKGCPKNTFLGLCEEGLIKNVEAGKYTRSIDNKRYALSAVDILKSNSEHVYSPKELWGKLNLGEKVHNSQMDVVLALLGEELIVL